VEKVKICYSVFFLLYYQNMMGEGGREYSVDPEKN